MRFPIARHPHPPLPRFAIQTNDFDRNLFGACLCAGLNERSRPHFNALSVNSLQRNTVRLPCLSMLNYSSLRTYRSSFFSDNNRQKLYSNTYDVFLFKINPIVWMRQSRWKNHGRKRWTAENAWNLDGFHCFVIIATIRHGVPVRFDWS